jgi:glycosyltransferase involved in cell wall biosynthesis
MRSPESPRVGIVYRVTSPGGAQSCVISLIRGLNRRGVVPDVIWDLPPARPLLERAGVQANFQPVRFPVPSRVMERLPDSFRYLAWIANTVEGDRFRGKYDCIYSFFNGFLMPPDTPHLYYLNGPPLLPQLEGTTRGIAAIPRLTFRWLYRKLWRRSRPIYEYHRSCNYVINSQYTARLFEEAHGVALPVVYPPVDLSGRTFEADDLAGRDSLVFFSRIAPAKRPEIVLELADRHRALRCVVMGGVPPNRRAYMERLQRQAAARGLPVVFHSNPPDAVVRQELARARYYVFPAIDEHFGMTTPEAIASGAIPFVHDSGGQREIVPDERLRFSDDEMHTKFDALQLLSDGELLEIRRRLRSHVEQYSEDAFLERVLPYLDGAGRSGGGYVAASATSA